MYFLFRRLDVLQACRSKFPHYFKTISTVMFPSWLKSRFPSALVALLWQAAFDFPNRLFHEFLSKSFLRMCLLRSKAPLKHIQPIKDES